MDWVIDTDVLARADAISIEHGHYFNVSYLLGHIRETSQSIAVDDQYVIFGEYHRTLRRNGPMIVFLTSLAQRGLVRYVSGNVPRKIQAGLAKLGFHDDDYVFVGVASRASGKTLVAEETDYSVAVVSLLVDHDITVVGCEDARQIAVS